MLGVKHRLASHNILSTQEFSACFYCHDIPICRTGQKKAQILLESDDCNIEQIVASISEVAIYFVVQIVGLRRNQPHAPQITLGNIFSRDPVKFHLRPRSENAAFIVNS